MDKVASDSLIKPDMPAVLERFHLALNENGFLLPLFEALSNAVDGVDARFDAFASVKGQIAIRFEHLNDPARFLLSVTDNGVGLDGDNYKSFRTPYSGYKLERRGRGFGRFIAFKVFNRVHYSSRYEENSVEQTRTFRFDIGREEEIVFHDGTPDFDGRGLRVEMDNARPEWAPLIQSLDREHIQEEIGAHFMPYFLNRPLPKITVQFNDEPPIEIAEHFKAMFKESISAPFTCEIDGVECDLTYTLTRVPRSARFRSHKVLFAAADRIVGQARDVSAKIGADSFEGPDGSKYVVIAIVRAQPSNSG
jgi:anti-sigma regulatory factor (Ser/Thr protein kinase)